MRKRITIRVDNNGSRKPINNQSVPFWTALMILGTAITAGNPRDRAIMAVWLSAPPDAVTKPATWSGLRSAVSAGVNSGLTMIALRGDFEKPLQMSLRDVSKAVPDITNIIGALSKIRIIHGKERLIQSDDFIMNGRLCVDAVLLDTCLNPRIRRDRFNIWL